MADLIKFTIEVNCRCIDKLFEVICSSKTVRVTEDLHWTPEKIHYLKIYILYFLESTKYII